MKTRCLPLAVLFTLLLAACLAADESTSHKLAKRQLGTRGLPLSRSRQFPPPEELESDEYESSDEDESPPSHRPFRGRQPPPPEEDYSDEYTYTEAPKTTTPAPRTTTRTVVFNNRFAARPRFGSPPSSTSIPSKPSAPSARTPAQSQRLDVVTSILSKPPSSRASARSFNLTKPLANEVEKKPDSVEDSRRVSAPPRTRTRGRIRTRATTSTTTTTTPPPTEEYYYYYEDGAEESPAPIATTTSTTTTTTTRRPTARSSFTRKPATRSRSTSRPVISFDPDAVQFAPPPDDPADAIQIPVSTATKKFTTSSTMSPEESGGIPPHLRSRYRPRTDGRFIDFLRDPNRPRELKGYDLTDYPFYITLPEDIIFDCGEKKDGYYASIPHKCQLFHYCFASQRYDFLCANYTVYDQTTFTCRFANHVDCDASEKFFFRNDELWKETPTTTQVPSSKKPYRRRPDPEDYDEDDYDYEEEEEERRRNRRRNRRRKNKRRQEEAKDEEKEKTK